MYLSILNEDNEPVATSQIPITVKQLLVYVAPILKKLAADISQTIVPSDKSFESLLLRGIVGLLNFLYTKSSKLKVTKEAYFSSLDKKLFLYIGSLVIITALLASIIFVTIFTVIYASKDLRNNFVYKKLISSSKTLLMDLQSFYHNKMDSTTTDKEKEELTIKFNYIHWQLKLMGKYIVRITQLKNEIQKTKMEFAQQGRNSFMQYLLTFGNTVKSFESVKTMALFLYLPFIALSSYLQVKLPGSIERLKHKIDEMARKEQAQDENLNTPSGNKPKKRTLTPEAIITLKRMAVPTLVQFYTYYIHRKIYALMDTPEYKNVDHKIKRKIELSYIFGAFFVNWEFSDVDNYARKNFKEKDIRKIYDLFHEWQALIKDQASKDAKIVADGHIQSAKEYKGNIVKGQPNDLPFSEIIKMFLGEYPESIVAKAVGL